MNYKINKSEESLAPLSLLVLGIMLLITPVLVMPASAYGLPVDSSLVVDRAEFSGLPVGKVWCSGNTRTRDHIILQELLLQSGDSYDLALIEESERNLRNMSYLGSAAIIPHLDADRGVVDIEIQVSDRFPFVFFPAPSFGGGRFDLNFIASNFNLFGRGQSLALAGTISSEEADTYIGWITEPRLGGSRWYTALRGGRQGNRGEQLGLTVKRPLFALSTRWAVEVNGFDWETEQRLYHLGYNVSRYYRRHIGGSFDLLRNFRREERRFAVGVSYLYFEEQNEQDVGWSGSIPEDKRRGTIDVRIELEKFRFVTDSYLFQMGPVEDIKMGPNLSIHVGAALKALGSDRDYPQFGLSAAWFGRASSRGYAKISLQANTRIEESKLTNHTGRANVGLWYHLGRYDLISFTARGEYQSQMEDPVQLLMGSRRGLRGFEAQAFDGNRLLISNVEWRHTLKVTRSWALALALFTDAGVIWYDSEEFSKLPLLVGSGAGFRLSIPGLVGGPVFRLDFGYGFRDSYFDISFSV